MKGMSALLVGAATIGGTAAIALMSMSSALAQGQTPGWYADIHAGVVIPEDPTADLHGSFFPGSPVKFHENVGAGVGVSLGYQGLFLPGIRAEGEIVYRTNDVNQATSPALGGTTGARGTIDSAGFMGNVLYDFMSDSQWTPYLCAGVGAARVTLNNISLPAFSSQTFSGNDWRFAYQGIAGVKYAFTPAVSVSLDYRYFATTDAHYTFPSSGFVTSATVPYHTHNVMLGLAYHFLPPPPPPPPVAAAPPPPPAPAPPPPARQFVVYFEFDKSDLTPEGAKVVQDAAAAYKQTGSARIAVTGYTDLAGTQQYNLGLSKRRADTVHRALVQDGVPDGAIAEAWRGKENPAVPTPDGVREPRNRRVEIAE
jgi:OmpA-OmpF porin, OOP family